MRNRKAIIGTFILAVLVCSLVGFRTQIQASESFAEPSVIRCTVYCDQGYTKSGQWVREGIVAGKEEWLGKAAILWEVDEDGSIGEFIGIYEFLDTGYGINGSIVNGTSIDVYCPSLDACWDWIGDHGDYVYLQIVDGKG